MQIKLLRWGCKNNLQKNILEIVVAVFPRQNMFNHWQHAHQFDVPLSIQHEILRLQVSVEDTFAMEVVESLCDTTNAEFGSGLIKTPPAEKAAKFKPFADKRGRVGHWSGGSEAG